MSYSIQVYPDVVLYLDIPIEEAERRRLGRDEAPTREEVKGLEFKSALRQGFRLLAEASQNNKNLRIEPLRNTYGDKFPIIEIDGMLHVETIAATIDGILEL